MSKFCTQCTHELEERKTIVKGSIRKSYLFCNSCDRFFKSIEIIRDKRLIYFVLHEIDDEREYKILNLTNPSEIKDYYNHLIKAGDLLLKNERENTLPDTILLRKKKKMLLKSLL